MRLVGVRKSPMIIGVAGNRISSVYVPIYVGPHTRMGYLQIAHSCFTADSQSRLKDASGE